MIKDFKALKLTLASPDDILAWSKGEVKKAETINYRTMRAEMDGLMCEKIFGPTKNYECFCGKYKKVRYKGIICDRCGVEVTNKRVRRERMGHIELASPVVHIWYSFGVPNKLSMILDIPHKKLEAVIYFASFLVVDVDYEKKDACIKKLNDDLEDKIKDLGKELKSEIDNEEKMYKGELEEAKKRLKKDKSAELQLEKLKGDNNKKLAMIRETIAAKEMKLKEEFKLMEDLAEGTSVGETITQEDHDKLVENDLKFFSVQMGADAIKTLLEKVDLVKEVKLLEKEKEKTRSVAKLKKIVQRHRMLKSMIQSGVKPGWLIVKHLPVIPADLRPIIQLAGGRFATSDLNDLYRRVINRNNRLKKLMDLGAPEIILRNEKRMLQEAVDALLDNNHRFGNPVLNSRNQPYKSLSDMLRGKQGRFRQNLLGKRVDYSGRAVIVAGPDLTAFECGLPQVIALELFKPFIIREIIGRGYASNIKAAKTFFDEKSPEVYDILEEVIKERPVLLNRAPTLHKQGIQAFYPVLTEGNAIRINPLVCKGFNADFDGDQMAVHVPLSEEAIKEAKERMMPDSNVLLMADASPVVNAAKDIIVGCYYLTRIDEKTEEVKNYSSSDEILKEYALGLVKHDQKIKVLLNGEFLETTVGRIIINSKLPEDYAFVNSQFDSGKISAVVSDIFTKYGARKSIEVLDSFKTLGFEYLTKSGMSISIDDYIISPLREGLVEEANKKEETLNEQFMGGMITQAEKSKLSQDIWMDTTNKVVDVTLKEYTIDNPIIFFDKSGGLPSKDPLRQSAAIRGLILDAQGHVVPLPLKSNYKIGMNTFEYFVAAKGTRKGLADTALKTSESGYLTRKLCDVAQDMITRISDCHTEHGTYLLRSSNRRLTFDKRITGRVPSEDLMSSDGKEVLAKMNEMITVDTARKIEADKEITKIKVRSALTCEAENGVCCMCYGSNLSTQAMVEKGLAVGIIAGQAMGQAATQLTLNTKHLAAKVGTDITQGLPRVEELFEARTPKSKALIAQIDGKVKIIEDKETGIKSIRISETEKIEKKYTMQKGDELKFARAKKVKKGDIIVIKEDKSELKAPIDGDVSKDGDLIIFKGTRNLEVEHELEKEAIITIADGDNVLAGTQLTDGSVDPKELMLFGALEKSQQYVIDSIQEVYGIQGIALDDRHVEIVVRKMSDYVRIVDEGESDLLQGDILPYSVVRTINKGLKDRGRGTSKFIREFLGITSASIKTPSFLSAASFQEQVRVLSEAALMGKVDDLKGLKENVIIGRPVPLGTKNVEM
ncbi:MAG: DNA-directed RNA polymerase subunit beta' [bacterium]